MSAVMTLAPVIPGRCPTLLCSARLGIVTFVFVSVPTDLSTTRTRKNERSRQTDCWILHEQAREYNWSGVGNLSIKTFFSGRAYYQFGCAHHAVDESSYLVANEGQRYTISIDSREEVESFCLFFAPGFAEQVQRSVSQKAERLLDDPWDDTPEPLRFFEKNYPHDGILSPAVRRLRNNYAASNPERLLEKLHDIVERLLIVHGIAVEEARCFDSVRAATREELYRRVWRARDYAGAMFAESVTLEDMARAACLSQNHLLRTFRRAFGETPHQFLIRRRLEEARRLLAGSALSVIEVCLSVGFESVSSFSTLFRKRFGISPSEFRSGKR
jgi:AraC family transcriptional regulator